MMIMPTWITLTLPRKNRLGRDKPSGDAGGGVAHPHTRVERPNIEEPETHGLMEAKGVSAEKVAVVSMHCPIVPVQHEQEKINEEKQRSIGTRSEDALAARCQQEFNPPFTELPGLQTVKEKAFNIPAPPIERSDPKTDYQAPHIDGAGARSTTADPAYESLGPIANSPAPPAAPLGSRACNSAPPVERSDPTANCQAPPAKGGAPRLQALWSQCRSQHDRPKLNRAGFQNRFDYSRTYESTMQDQGRLAAQISTSQFSDEGPRDHSKENEDQGVPPATCCSPSMAWPGVPGSALFPKYLAHERTPTYLPRLSDNCDMQTRPQWPPHDHSSWWQHL